MERRTFVSASLAVSALSLAGSAKGVGQTASATAEYYDLRRYQLTSGPGTKLTDNYFADALIPALNRLGIGPVGAFSVYFGPETPAYYLLMPSSKLETLVTADLALAEDPLFVKAGAPFWDAPAGSPPFTRIESSLLRAFAGYPRVTPPASAATKGRRIYQLRQYQSPTNAHHRAPSAQGGDVPRGRIRDLREGGSAWGVLCGYADWAAAAEPDVYAQLPGYGCARVRVGQGWRRSGLEEAVERSEVQAGSADSLEHYEPGASAAGMLADLVHLCIARPG